MVKLTKAQRRWAFEHAKKHVVEALTEVCVEEHHAVVTAPTAGEGSAIHALIMQHLERMLRDAKRESFIDVRE